MRDIMTSVIKINNKVFTVVMRLSSGVYRAECPDGQDCIIQYKTKTSGQVLHRDILGRIQSEPFNLKVRYARTASMIAVAT